MGVGQMNLGQIIFGKLKIWLAMSSKNYPRSEKAFGQMAFGSKGISV